MKLRTSCFLALALVAGHAAAEERHLGPHVHGQATLQVSVDGSTLAVGLSIPGHDAVGFEHPPTSAEQTATLAKATETLRGGTWLVPVAAAGCKAPPARVVADGFDASAKPGAHGDFDVTYQFTCANPEQLASLEVGLFKAFPALQRVVVDIVGANGAAEQILDHTTTQVTLSP